MMPRFRSRNPRTRLIIWIVIALVTTAGLGLAGYYLYQHQREKNTQNLLDSARASVEAGDWQPAMAHYRQYLNRMPEDREALAEYARLLGDRAEDSPELIMQASRTLQRLLNLEPTNAWATGRLTEFLVVMQSFGEAESQAKRWLQLQPDSTDAEFYLAAARRGLGRYDEAAGGLEAALTRDPTAVRLYAALIGVLTVELERPDDARTWLERALEVAPDSAEVHRAAFAYFQNQGDMSQAERHLQRSLALAPEELESLVPAAALYLNQDRLAEAEAAIGRARELHPKNRAVLMLAADLAVKSGKRDQMQAVAAEMVEQGQASAPQLLARAAELYLTARDQEGVDRCLELLDEKPLTPRMTSWVTALRGSRALLEDRPHAAVAQLESAVLDRSDDPQALELLAVAYDEAGDLDSASSTYERLVNLRPDAAEPRLAWARLELERGDAGRARFIASRVDPSTEAQERQLALVRLLCDVFDWREAGQSQGRREALVQRMGQALAAPFPDAASARLAARCLTNLSFPAELDGPLNERIADARYGETLAVARGRHELESGDLAAAEKTSAWLLQRESAGAAGHVLKLMILARQQGLVSAMSSLESGDWPEQHLDELYLALSEQAAVAGDQEVARRALTEAAGHRPADVSLRIRLAASAETQADALQTVEEIRRLEGENGVTWRIERAAALLRFAASAEQTEEARQLLSRCLTQRPDWIRARLLLGDAQERLGDDAAAIETLQAGLAQQPALAEGPVGFRLARLLKRTGRFVEADQLLEQLARRFPDAPEVLRQQTERQMRLRDVQAAAASAEKALALDSGDTQWAALTADLQLGAGRPERAEEIARQALSADPASTQLTWVLARAITAQGRPEDAVEAVRRLAEANNTPASYLILARLHEDGGRAEAAEQAVDKALALAPQDANTLAAVAEFWAARGDRPKRLELTRRAVLASGQDPDHSIAMAELLASGGSTEERRQAERIVAERLQQDAGDWRALVLSARLAGSAESPDLDHSESQLRRALQQNPQATGAHELLAAVQIRLGKLREASDTVQQGLAQNPDDIPLLLLSAELAGYRGEYELAVPSLRRVLEIRPGMPQATRLLATAYERLDWYDRGIAMFEQIARTQPSEAATLGLARLHEGKGDLATSRRYFEQVADSSRGSQEAVMAFFYFLARHGDWSTLYEAATDRSKAHPDDHLSRAVAGQLMGSQQQDPALREMGLNWLFELGREVPGFAADATFRAGLCYYQAGDFPAAESRFQEAVRLEPQAPEAVNALAWLYTEHLGRPADAVALLEQFVAQGGRETAEMLDTFGTALLRTGRLDQAAEKLQRAVTVAGQTSTLTAATFHLGQVEEKRSNTRRARELYQRASDLHQRLGGLGEADLAHLRDILGG